MGVGVRHVEGRRDALVLDRGVLNVRAVVPYSHIIVVLYWSTDL